MKKTTLLLIIFATHYIVASGQTSSTAHPTKFLGVMKENLLMLDTARHASTYMILANNFERVGNAEKKFWQPFYYASFCYAVMAMEVKEKDKIDGLTLKAESFLEKAGTLSPGNSEISALQAMIINTKILADPIGRWRDYSVQSAEHLKKAKEQNPANPRPYLIEARTKLFTPPALGGGADAAKPFIEEAINKFNQFQPASSIDPIWGQTQAEKLLQSLNK